LDSEQLLVDLLQLVAMQQKPMSVPLHRPVHAPPSHVIPGPHEVFRQMASPVPALTKMPLLQELAPVQRTTAAPAATASMR
jgi:hypothetical protein